MQPIIAKEFSSKEVSKASIVIATELTKICIAIVAVSSEPSSVRKRILSDWTLSSSLKIAALPAVLYAIQNLMVQHAYILLDSMTFNLLNQTKTLSAALWLFFILNKRQTSQQVFALFLLLAAAVVLNIPVESYFQKYIDSFLQSSSVKAIVSEEKAVGNAADYQLGVLMVLGASMLSGLSTALTQRALTNALPRHALFFSAELAVYGILALFASLAASTDWVKVCTDFFYRKRYSNVWYNAVIDFKVFDKGEVPSFSLHKGWELQTFVPVLTNAFGGVAVGLVTKYAGGVVKVCRYTSHFSSSRSLSMTNRGLL